MNNKSKISVNFGCGSVRPVGWKNYDSSLNSFLQSIPIVKRVSKSYLKSVEYTQSAKYLDLRKKWPFISATVSVIYASHLLEHLTQKQASHFMSEAYRSLIPNEVIRIVVPDLRALSEEYLSNLEAKEDKASQDFLYAVNLHKENTYSSNSNILTRLINLTQGYPHQHKYMYDEFSLKKLLFDSGFQEIVMCTYGESKNIENIKDVECTAEGIPSIYIEARKPD